MSNDSLGDRMKSYERAYEQRLMPQVPAIVRLDGKGFHKVTSKMDRPFDQDFIDVMHHVTFTLVDYSNAHIGYHQSDEITLVLYNDNPQGELFFAGKCNKLNSVLASKASRIYNEMAAVYDGESRMPFVIAFKWLLARCILIKSAKTRIVQNYRI